MNNWTKLTKEDQLTILSNVAEDIGIVDISFLPPLKIADILREDYQKMQIGFIYADAPSFDEIMARLQELQERFRALK